MCVSVCVYLHGGGRPRVCALQSMVSQPWVSSLGPHTTLFKTYMTINLWGAHDF